MKASGDSPTMLSTTRHLFCNRLEIQACLIFQNELNHFFSLHDFEFLLEIKLKHSLLLRKAAKLSVRVFLIQTRGTFGIASLYCIMLGHKP